MSEILYRFGTCSVSADQVQDPTITESGRDGLIYLPPNNGTPGVMAVADGIGKQGFGQRVLDRFGIIFSQTRDIREAVLTIAGSDPSTFVGIELPTSFKKPARVISLGDSSAFQIQRSGNGEATFEALTEADTVWEYLRDLYPWLQETIRSLSRGECSSREVQRTFRIISVYLSEVVRLNPRNPIYKQVDNFFTCSVHHEKQQILAMLLAYMDEIVILDLSSESEEIEKRLRCEMATTLSPRDILVVHSDGIDLMDNECEEILLKHEPQQAAEELVRRSQKIDDRAVVVVHVDAMPA
jgi:hypothetical protein